MLKDLHEKLSLMEISSMSFAIYRTNCRNFAYGVYAHEAYCSILYRQDASMSWHCCIT